MENENNGFYFENGTTDTIIVCFQSRAVQNLNKFEWLESIKRLNLNCGILIIKDYSSKWYLSRLRNIGKNHRHTVSFIKNKVESYNKRIFIGSSMGGFGALLYGTICNANLIFAFSPQTNLRKNITNQRQLWRIPFVKEYGDLSQVLQTGMKIFYIQKLPKDDSDPLHGLSNYTNIEKFVEKLIEEDNIEFLKNGNFEKYIKEITNE